jgi:hypothetical protein
MKYVAIFFVFMFVSAMSTIGIMAVIIMAMPNVNATSEECARVHTPVEMAELAEKYIVSGNLPWYSKLVCERVGDSK